MSAQTQTIVLQFFADDLLANITDDENPVLVKAMSAIIPTDGNRRQKMARFSGSVAEYRAARIANSTYHGFVVPAGTALVWAVGARGGTVAAQSLFAEVPVADLIDLGEGTSAQLAERFTGQTGGDLVGA